MQLFKLLITGSGGDSGSNSSGNCSGGSSGNPSGNTKALAASRPLPVFASLKQQLAAMGLAMREIPGDG